MAMALKMGTEPLHLDDLVQYVTLHVPLKSLLNGSVMPFFFLYAILGFLILSYEDHFEAGLVCIAVVGFVQILVCLFCFWSVHINTFLNYRKVRTGSRFNYLTRHV